MIIKHNAVIPIEFDDLKIYDYTSGQESSSSLAEVCVPIGIRHRHSWSKRSDKYYYAIKGRVSFTVDDETIELSSGDVCIILQGQRFSYINDGTEDAKLILVHTPSFKLEYEVFGE